MRLASIFLVMPIEVFLMVLGAAFVHAAWNALVKADGDRFALIKLSRSLPHSLEPWR
jgi:predicted small integral membrane protein